jgi:Ser/Thr protein kinase RdoA (MazF antagonist)
VSEDLRAVGAAFGIEGRFRGAEPVKTGHIHTTWVAVWERGGCVERFVHQRLNGHVFRDPEAVMRNLVRVSEHLGAAVARAGLAEPERRRLRVLRTREGELLHRDGADGPWRTVRFVEGARTRDVVEGPEQAREAARAFGAFAAALADLPPRALAVTIPDFHDLAKRLGKLEAAAGADPRGRLAAVCADVDAAFACADRLRAAPEWPALASLPRRVVHNDCKLNNLLLDERTGEGLCVIDLDTVMEGTVAFDFGELVRTATCSAPEDETRLERIAVDRGLYAALARGYREGAPFLTPAEIEALPLAGPLMALENAVRFLSDHLEGDLYFRVHRAGQNLDRHRAQRTLAERMLAGLDAARRDVRGGC